MGHVKCDVPLRYQEEKIRYQTRAQRRGQAGAMSVLIKALGEGKKVTYNSASRNFIAEHRRMSLNNKLRRSSQRETWEGWKICVAEAEVKESFTNEDVVNCVKA